MRTVPATNILFSSLIAIISFPTQHDFTERDGMYYFYLIVTVVSMLLWPATIYIVGFSHTNIIKEIKELIFPSTETEQAEQDIALLTAN